MIDLGDSSPSGSITISNVGDLPVMFSVTGSLGRFVVTPSTATLQGGASTQLTASIDRSSLAEGDTQTTQISIQSGAQAFPVALSAGVERPPTIGPVNGAYSQCVPNQQFTIGADVAPTDESTPLSATFSVTGPGGLSATDQMSPDGGRYFGATSFAIVSSADVHGTWQWSITVTDQRGNSSSTSGTHAVPGASVNCT